MRISVTSWHLPCLTAWQLLLLTAVFVTATGNMTFFSKLLETFPWSEAHFGFLISVAVVFVALLALIMSLFSLFLPIRFVVSMMLLLAAAIGHYSDQFGVIVDGAMLNNVLETNSGEAIEILSPDFFIRLLILGIIPIALVWTLPVRATTHLHRLSQYGLTAASSTLVILACVLAFSVQYISVFREHKTLRMYTNPTYALFSMSQLFPSAAASAGTQPVQILTDARIRTEDHGRDLMIMVVGETARRDRFSLNGYERLTNPELGRESRLVSYANISACGTSTAVSVPCMFAVSGRHGFDRKAALKSENVLDVLQRAGVHVLWRDNNSSSKGVADRVAFEDFRTPELNPDCETECRDVGMLSGLQQYIDATDGDILIVLHQMGNHGPAYSNRYPAEFERFTPACRSTELSACTKEELGNAYDNAILYTDYFLARVIELLKLNTPEFETAMIYVSDHGESLGESGLYLHGMPYSIAPAEQTEVPVILWLGDTSHIDLTSALDLRNEANSHDAVFRSLLLAFEIESRDLPAGNPLFLLSDRNVP